MTNPAALIDPHNCDNSAETKQVTYYGEIADFIQFMTMTTFSDGFNAVARYGFGKESFIPVQGLVGMDILSYSIMTALAYYREEKFLQRHDLFVDKNSAAYYQHKAKALLAALNEDELAELERNRGSKDAESYIIHLLKYDARAISPHNLPAAKTLLDKWRHIFEKVRHRKHYSALYYNFKTADLRSDLSFHSEDRVALDFEGAYHFKSIEHHFVENVLKTFSSRLINEVHVEQFIYELSLLEKTPQVSLHQAQQALLARFRVDNSADRDRALTLLHTFYRHYHSYHDRNDLAFYKANSRGTLKAELDRTAFKAKLFGTVKNVSAMATAYSVGSFLASFFVSLSVANIFAPIFLVGTTSLVDEWTDCNYKEKKLKESRADLEAWMADEENQKAYAVFQGLTIMNADHIANFSENRDNRAVIWSHYLAVKNDTNEPFNLLRHGHDYLRAKAQEHQDLTARISRREIKFKQACMSFTGVFFGVLISMAVGVVAMTMGMGQVTDILGFVGFGTIFTAAMAGLYMIKYQNGQHGNKAIQAENLRATQLESLSTTRPLRFTAYPDEPKLEETCKKTPEMSYS